MGRTEPSCFPLPSTSPAPPLPHPPQTRYFMDQEWAGLWNNTWAWSQPHAQEDNTSLKRAWRSPVDRKGLIIHKLDQKEASCHVLKSLQDKEGMERVKSRPITVGNRNNLTLPYQASMGSERYLALVQITWKCFQEKFNLPRSSDYQGPKPVSHGWTQQWKKLWPQTWCASLPAPRASVTAPFPAYLCQSRQLWDSWEEKPQDSQCLSSRMKQASFSFPTGLQEGPSPSKQGAQRTSGGSQWVFTTAYFNPFLSQASTLSLKKTNF